MDNLKLIPQVFFDLIGRVIPGIAGIVAILLLTKTNWGEHLVAVFGETLGNPISPTLTILSFFVSAYVMGQLISPLTKIVQWLGELDWFKPKPKLDGAYDWLRLHKPGAGDSCAKIRAEFMMHNGLSVVFFISLIWYPFSRINLSTTIILGLAALVILTAYRGHKTRDTFNETVKKFAKAADYPGLKERPNKAN